ncbi:hypothetical protein AX15_004470 [Amanita polypyramis BW_CC]|nr:hypothetical protein AX15_004470 [Amanita polypyramis BW_CC]
MSDKRPRKASSSAATDIHPGVGLGKSGTRRYHRQVPQFWSIGPTTSQVLYPTIVAFDHAADSRKPYAPMLILTRHPLPTFESYHSFFKGVPVTTHLLNAAPVEVDTDQLRHLGLFTLRICRLIMNRPFVCTLDDMLYFFAPLRSDCIPADEMLSTPSIFRCVSWDVITQCITTFCLPIMTDSSDSIEQDIQDAVIQDRWTEFTRRYEVVKLRSDLTPHSPIPNDSGEPSSGTLLDGYKSKSRSFTGLRNDVQPVIEVSMMECHANYLSPAVQTAGPKPVIKYLIPEFCNKLTISASVLRTALVLPSVLYKIDNLLRAKELNTTIFNDVLSDGLLNMATTCPSACMEFDYERLELLGDAFLKYLTTVYIITSNGSRDEGAMHTTRERMINNKNLTQNALQIELPGFIESRPFLPKQWTPPNFIINQSSSDLLDTSNTHEMEAPQTKRKEEQIHWLADKTVADVAEAIIGAAYLSGGSGTALKIVKTLRVPLPSVACWSELQRNVSSFANSMSDVFISWVVGAVKSIETLIHYEFKRPHPLAQALLRQNSTILNAFEFAGDAILGFLVARYVFNREPRLSSGGLSLLKGAMISNSTLGIIAVSSRLLDHIPCLPRDIMTTLNTFTEKLNNRQREENRRAEKGVSSQYWQGIEPPKLLVNFIKSIIGALYISDHSSFTGVELFFENIFRPFYDKHITLNMLAPRPTATLVELLRAHGCQLFDIKKEAIGQITRCQVLVHNQVVANTEDRKPSYAVIGACRSALDSLTNSGILSTHCDCRAHPNRKKKEGSFKHLLTLESQEII